MGEPIIQGLVIGIVLGIIGYYNAGDAATVISKVLQTGMNLAAVMLLLPRMVKILMEGLIPVSEAARTFMQKRAGGREFYIGLDSAILIGHPAAISSSLILVPLAILLSIILPGNRVLLFADLAIIPFVVAMCAPLMKGNVVRIIIAGFITLGRWFLHRQPAWLICSPQPLLLPSFAPARRRSAKSSPLVMVSCGRRLSSPTW